MMTACTVHSAECDCGPVLVAVNVLMERLGEMPPDWRGELGRELLAVVRAGLDVEKKLDEWKTRALAAEARLAGGPYR